MGNGGALRAIAARFSRVIVGAAVLCATCSMLCLQAQPSFAATGNAVIDSSSCQANTLPANDDGSTGAISLPFTLNFFGSQYSGLYVNNNGNVTFAAPMSTYTPFALTSTTPPIIAPFFADVDTRGTGSGQVTYGTTTFEGHQAFCVEWPDVGYYDEETDKLNDFELLLVDRSDAGAGDFDIVFNYDQVQWETGDASGGTDGLGGTSAAVGFSAGDGNASDSYQLAGSLENGAFLDSNTATGLATHDLNSTVPGRYIFHVTGAAGGGGELSGLERPWPTDGYGYNFPNRPASTYLSDSGLSRASVLNDSTMSNVFSDWSSATGSSSNQNTILNELLNAGNTGVCYGLALSGGRFDAGFAQLYDPSAGRSDPVWSDAGSGPSASENLPEPGTSYSDTAYDTQFLTRVEEDFTSQYSEESLASRQAQHFAYADPTTGVSALEAQLQSVMSSGTNLYPPPNGPSLSTAGGNGFAMIILQADNSTISGDQWVGHAVLAYSAEIQSDGTLEIDVWDNDYPFTPYEIDVQPDGEWIYNAPDGVFSGEMSMSGQPGDTLGELAVLPLYDPVGLHFDPNYSTSSTDSLGSGSFVDVPAGEAIASATDSAQDPVDVEANAADGTDQGGEVVDFPSGDGNLTLTGPDPSIDVRNSDSFMQAQSTDTSGQQQQVSYSAEPDQGTISASGAPAQLTATQGSSEAVSTGAQSLTYASDGSVFTSGDSGTVTVGLDFDHDGSPLTAQLYSGAAPASGQLSFSAAQVAAAETAAATTTTGGGSGGGGGGGGSTSSTAGGSRTPAPRVAQLSRVGKIAVSGHVATLRLKCSATAGTRCQVKAALSVIETLKGKRMIAVAASAKQRRTVRLASASASIPAGRTVTLKLVLNAAGRKLLARRSFKAKLSVGLAGKPDISAVLHFRRRR